MMRGRLAWGVVAAGLALLVASRLLYADPGESLTEVTAILLFGVVGATILSRHPRHPVGLTFLGAYALYAVATALVTYAQYALTRDPTLTGAAWAAWLPHAGFVALFTLLVHPRVREPRDRVTSLAGAEGTYRRPGPGTTITGRSLADRTEPTP